jgi:hypothetical protein
MKNIFIEAESFKEKGGWVIDTASMETIHSAYLMAHGMGNPVEDAFTDFEITDNGIYSIYALTRDWTAVWDVKDSAGKFTIKLDGIELSEILGTNGKDWAWQFAGKVPLEKGTHSISLHDLTGFNGRCDAIYFTASDETPDSAVPSIDEMRRELNWKEIQDCPETFDLVVVGGGIAGICTALSAIRKGVHVALINDRSILGGCNSSEIRVCMGGMINLPPYPNLGKIVKEIAPIVGYPSIYEKECYEDYRKMAAFQVREEKYADCKIFTNEFVSDIEKDGKKITGVICTNTVTGQKTRIIGKTFADCSGDAVLARKMGCETM